MSLLQSFLYNNVSESSSLSPTTLAHKQQRQLNVAIVGASGGIGQALLSTLLDMSLIQNLYALSRKTMTVKKIDTVKNNLKHFQHLSLDMTDETSIKAAADEIAQNGHALDLVIVATGMLHDKQQSIMPEKALKQLEADHFLQLMWVNTLGPSLIAKYFLPLMQKQKRAYMGFLSARVGSISDNGLGGWHSYRASKAALNMMIKNMAIEYRRKCPELIISGLHPGTVETDLSQPFQKNVKPEKLFSAQQSAHYLLNVIDGLNTSDSGNCFAWDGKVIPS